MAAKVMGDDALLQKALGDLMDSWATTSEVWRDDARDDFSTTFMVPIEDRARQAVKAINMLESLIAEANRQCQ